MKPNDTKNAPKEHFIYRVKFSKMGQMKFIGHLDLLRLFQRIIRQAHLPVAYSNGFNPHPLLSFASPLALGITSESEYGDFEMAQKIEPYFILERLNQYLPEGLEILDCVLLKEHAQSAMASVESAKYLVTFPQEIMPEQIEAAIPEYLKQSEILIMKKTKKKIQETNIREDIFAIESHSIQKAKLYFYLAAGSQRNLKPELVAESLCQFMKVPFPRYQVQYHRISLLRKEGENRIELDKKIGVRRLGDELI